MLTHQSIAGMTCSVGLFVSEKVRLTSTHLLSLQNVYIVKFTSYYTVGLSLENKPNSKMEAEIGLANR